MLVTFNPMINTGSDVNAAYMNFLRCVRAIATASAGTSSLTVNPFTNNTGNIDSTRNCIVSIDANTEGGGWTESTSSNVIQSGSFTAIASAAAGLYKFDAYTTSGKGSLPYLKMTFCDSIQTSSSGSVYGQGAHYGGVHSQFATYPFIQFTFGASTTTDWTDTAYRPSNSSYPNYTGQTLSWTMNAFGSNTSNTPSSTTPMFWANNPTVNYKMAVTANYCIIWEVHTSNSYITNFSNTFATVPSSYQANISYGGLMYGGLRETQAWENSRSDNPPWATIQAYHRTASPDNSGPNPTPANNFAAYMATINDAGVPSATSSKYFTNDTYVTSSTVFGLTSEPFNQSTTSGIGIGPGSQTLCQGLAVPLFWGRDNGMTSLTVTAQLYMPTVDTTTGTGVPSAYPIMIRRVASGTWNPGGAVRGLYKSLSMPIDTMKNYFANGQTFSIYNSVTASTDTYIPIVFHNTMYLVRYA
jgi:hypothetical protein